MRRVLLALTICVQCGCASSGLEEPTSVGIRSQPVRALIDSQPPAAADVPETLSESPSLGSARVVPVSAEDAVVEDTEPAIAQIGTALLELRHRNEPRLLPVSGEAPLAPPAEAATDRLLLEEVIGSVYQSFPLLEASYFQRNIAAGEQLAASGEFDLKLKGAVETGPAGYYETYRNNVGLAQPLYTGGEAFAGYRIGRGSFQPWYKERQTNSGGEFKAGVAVPLCRDRDIDPRRAELWKAGLGRQLAEPEIQAELIAFVLDASYTYWEWVAAGAKLRIAERVLDLAEERNERIRRQVEEQLLDPPELTDNLRLVAERRGKLADAERKFRQTSVKLSLFYRSANGEPVIPDSSMLPEFPELDPIDPDAVMYDAQRALQQRPELAIYDLQRRQLDIDYAQAQNEYRPMIDGVLAASQDLGAPTSNKKDDKSEFEVEASIFVELPIQRRKARGKMQAISGKVSQLNAKRRMTEDKIVAEVQAAHAALVAAQEQVRQAREAVGFAEDLARRERRNFELGASDLLKVTLREQYAAESAEKAADAMLLYHAARADYRAALAIDEVPPTP